MDLFEYMRENFSEDDSPLAKRMRPTSLDDVVGQEHIIGKDKLLYRAIKADKISSLIFYGPPGTGKTTLAMVIANTTKAEFRQLNATTAGKKDMEKVVEEAKNTKAMYGRRTILFIDEIHRLSRSVEEILYPAMEDFAIDIVNGKGQGAASIHLPLPKFTLIGATTRAGQLSAPLRDRFGVVMRLELYTPEELGQIVARSAHILDIPCDWDGALEIASRCRGTPRIANRMLKRVRDFAQVMNHGEINAETASAALGRLEVDELGLDMVDRRMLEAMISYYNGGPVGLDTLAAVIGEEAVTIEDVYEPYLMQIGFLSRTPRGRVVLPAAYDHLGLPRPGASSEETGNPSLFDAADNG